MKKWAMALTIVAVLGLSGCSTTFHGSAPADADHIYVVGGKIKPFLGWRPVVWRCPAKTRGDCEEVHVND